MNNKILFHLETSLKINPKFSPPLLIIAEHHIKNKRFTKAISTINKAINIERKIIDDSKLKIEAYQKEKNFLMIKSLSLTIIKHNKIISSYFLKSAKIYLNNKKYLQAEKMLLKSVQFYDGDANPFYYLSKITKNKEQSKKFYKRAIEIDPEFSLF